jgi:spermidine synthase
VTTPDSQLLAESKRHDDRQVLPGAGLALSALAALFFCSGACSLVYQVLWLRMLGWVFGVTVYAASTVWAVFMAGLAVGSLAAGLVADRVRRPLRWFGGAELLIGLTALATPLLLDWLQRVYVSAYPSLPHTPAAVTAARVVMAFLVLLAPTALMGATLPLVLKASAFRTSALGAQVGLLYGSNAAGAIAGTLAAGLYLIPQRGIQGTFLIAAILNIIVGLSAILWSARSPISPPTAAGRPPDPTVNSSGREAASAGAMARTSLNVILVVFTVSGAVALALEVVWFRVLTLFLRPTVYGFAVMLGTILTGIAIGSYLVTPLLTRRMRWVLVLGCFEIAIALAVLLSFGPLGYLPRLSATITPIVRSFLPEYLGYPITGAFLAMLPTSLLMGMAFPIGLHLWAAGARTSTQTAGRIGVFYALNVGGAIVGSLAAGFFLLPWLGSRASLVLLATLTLASGVILVAVSELTQPRRAAAIAAAVAVFTVAWRVSPDPFVQFVAQRYPGQQIVWQEEGVEATVVVHRNRARELSLTVNGNHEASTGGPMTYIHRRIGHLPMAIHKDPRTALVIGLGGGATAGAVSIHDGVQVDVVELAGAVVRGARFFEDINYGVLSRPNVRLRVDDGRNYMMLTPNRYDVITADVIIPIFAGSGNLYSVEYFRLMKRVLNPGGVVLQWVAGTEAEYKTITRTFLSVFPETTAWVGGELLVGSVEPLRLSREDFERRLALPGSARGLKDLGIESFDRLLSVFTAGPDELRTFVGPGPLLTDDRPLAEYFLSLPRDRDPDFTTLKGDVQRYVATE